MMRAQILPIDPNAKRHGNFKDLSGQRFGRLAVIRPVARKRQNYVWECLCDCGNNTIVKGARLSTGKTTSCGCFRKEVTVARSKTHGLTKTRTHAIWNGMKNRCLNKNVRAYPDYGGRGINVCERWMKFENFVADMGLAPEGLTIERKNNNGNYEPENCIWATQLVQARNSRKNVLLTAFGITRCVSEWAANIGLKPATLYRRIRAGWVVESALTKPLVNVGRTRQSENNP